METLETDESTPSHSFDESAPHRSTPPARIAAAGRLGQRSVRELESSDSSRHRCSCAVPFVLVPSLSFATHFSSAHTHSLITLAAPTARPRLSAAAARCPLPSAMAELDPASLSHLYRWIDTIPLDRPKKNIARDFSDGVLMSQVVHYFFPKLVELHNYSASNSIDQKNYNWKTLNREKDIQRTGAVAACFRCSDRRRR